MPRENNKRRRGSETKDAFKRRLCAEGLWQRYIAERDELCGTQNITSAQAHNLIYDKYAPGKVVSPIKKTESGKAVAETLFEDTLPNGCPLFDESLWEDKASTNLLDDVRWVADHLGLRDFDYINRSPSLRACTLYWEARYTLAGMQRYQDLLRQLEIPDKATLKDLNRRKDDGGELDKLSDFLDLYINHQSEQDR